MATVGERVKTIREQRGLTQETLAVRAGLGAATIRRVENATHETRLSTLAAIAEELDISVAVLLGHEPEPAEAAS